MDNHRFLQLSFLEFKDLLRCVECGSIEPAGGMAMLKCMHFVCTKKKVNEELTCLEKVITKTSGPGEAKQAEDSSGTSRELFKCWICRLTSNVKDIELRKEYTREVLQLFQVNMVAWDGGRRKKIRCERCGEECVCFPGITVCTRCAPKSFFCFQCARFHLESYPDHHSHIREYNSYWDEWDALCNMLRMYPEHAINTTAATSQILQGNHASSDARRTPATDNGTNTAEATATGVDSSRSVSPDGEKAGLLAKITYNINLIISFQACICQTNYDFRNRKHPYSEQLFQFRNAEYGEAARGMKFQDIELLVHHYSTYCHRAVAHGRILQILVQVKPEKQAVWLAIQTHFSINVIRENSDYPMTEVWRCDSASFSYNRTCSLYVIPYIQELIYRKFVKEDMYSAIIARVPKLKGLPTIQISVSKLDDGNNFQEVDTVRQQHIYEEVSDEGSHGILEATVKRAMNASRCIHVSDTFFACSSHDAVEMVWIYHETKAVRQTCKLSEDGERFGEGLWFDDPELYALLVGTKTVVQWVLSTAGCLVKKQYIQILESPFTFLPTDTLVTKPGYICVCFDTQRPLPQQEQPMPRPNYFWFRRSSHKDFKHMDFNYQLQQPVLFKRPLLLGCPLYYKLVLLERTQEEHCLMVQARDTSWHKIRFQFGQQPPLHVIDVWLSKRSMLNVLYELPAPQQEVSGSATAPAAKSVRKIRIELARSKQKLRTIL